MYKRVSKWPVQDWLSLFFLATALLIVLPLAAFAQGAVAAPTPCDPEDPNCCPGPFCPPPSVLVRGTVRSCAGVGVAGVTVEIVGEDVSVTRTTNASGFYSASVPVGTYTVTPIAPPGYFFSPQSQQSSGFGFTDFTRYPRDNRANFDGDCKTDISIFTLSNGVWGSINSSNGQYVGVQFGQTGDILTPGDYNGDGKTDRAVFRPGNGYWYVTTDAGITFYGFQFGQSGDIPAARDYDGDGKTDVAVFRPSNGYWYILNSSNSSVTIVQFGANGDRPVPGQYDDDGKADLAVWRPSQGAWYIRKSSDGSVTGQYFGSSSDMPVPSFYIPQ